MEYQKINIIRKGIFCGNTGIQKLLLASMVLPFVFAACSPNNVKEDESLKKYFDSANVTGCFGLFDNSQGHFTIYNLKRFRDSSFLPASTFKIVNSLIGIQTGVITDEQMVIKWDGVKRWNPDWNQEKPVDGMMRHLFYLRGLYRRVVVRRS